LSDVRVRVRARVRTIYYTTVFTRGVEHSFTTRSSRGVEV